MVFGVTRGLAAELPEVTNIVERYRGLSEPFVFGIHRAGAGEVKHRPQKHRGMTVGEHEPVAVRPNRVLRIEAHDAVPERVDERRQRHRRARMPRHFACWTASIDSVRMQLIDNWSNCALVIGRGEFTAAVAILLIFAPQISRWRRAVPPPRDQQVSAPDPDARGTPEWMDRCRAGARAFQPSHGRSPAIGRAGTG